MVIFNIEYNIFLLKYNLLQYIFNIDFLFLLQTTSKELPKA